MINLAKTTENKLFITKGGNMECKPWGIETYGESSSHVRFTSLIDRESVYKGHFSDFGVEGVVFPSLDALLEYVTPALGFKTATGGSVAPANNNADLIKTGQTTNYFPGDDGDLFQGRGVDFFTLDQVNIFGNSNRFTDLEGGQDYVDDIVLDHSTYDGNKMLGYSRQPISPDSWEAQVEIIGDFPGGWGMTNIRQLQNIAHYGQIGVFSYAPFNFDPLIPFYTSTTVISAVGNVFLCQPVGWIGTADKFGAHFAIRCRYFTSAELGI